LGGGFKQNIVNHLAVVVSDTRDLFRQLDYVRLFSGPATMNYDSTGFQTGLRTSKGMAPIQ
jgi:hypothetical protein